MTTQTFTEADIANLPGMAELVDWVQTLPSKDAITAEVIGAELERRWNTVPYTTVAGVAIEKWGTARLAGTYDEFRAEAGLSS